MPGRESLGPAARSEESSATKQLEASRWSPGETERADGRLVSDRSLKQMSARQRVPICGAPMPQRWAPGSPPGTPVVGQSGATSVRSWHTSLWLGPRLDWNSAITSDKVVTRMRRLRDENRSRTSFGTICLLRLQGWIPTWIVWRADGLLYHLRMGDFGFKRRAWLFEKLGEKLPHKSGARPRSGIAKILG